jgi:hypothetical protein
LPKGQPSVAVIMELENATSLKDTKDLSVSVQSVLTSLEGLCQREKIAGEIVFSGQKAQCEHLVEELESLAARFPSVELKIFDNSGCGYFSAKSNAVDLAASDFIVFCDSDCSYEIPYVTKMYEALQAAPNSVVYGKTYALHPRSKLEEHSSLAWLFPPEYIGYGWSWPKSTWANSMAMHRTTLESHPFPEIIIERFPGIETKQERPIWASRLGSYSIQEVEIDALAYHVQFSSRWEWFGRQFTHGVGFSIKEKNPASRILSAGKTEIGVRLDHLQELRVKRLIKARQYYGAVSLLVIAFLARSLGYVTVKLLRLKLQISWPAPKKR